MAAPRPSLLGPRSFTNGTDTPPLPLGTDTKGFPHIRAVLATIARQYRSDLDLGTIGDEGRVDSALVNRVFTLLDNEDEEQLQALLKETYSIADDEEVRTSPTFISSVQDDNRICSSGRATRSRAHACPTQ
jgi:hypothetical protein